MLKFIYKKYCAVMLELLHNGWKLVQRQIVLDYLNKIPTKMTDKELLNELDELCSCSGPYKNNHFFTKSPLFKYEIDDPSLIKARRSFGDLFKRYRRRGVTELQLMRVLGDPNNKFIGNLCPDIYKVVFFKLKYGAAYKYSSYSMVDFNHSRDSVTYKKKWCDGKYTMRYLENLWDQLYVDDLSRLKAYYKRHGISPSRDALIRREVAVVG